jgi:hypothetical protein
LGESMMDVWRKVIGASGEAVAKRAFWLAWQACGGPLGMGFLQDNPDATEEDVWANVQSYGDYPATPARGAGEVYGDYVFGRMMKLGLRFSTDTVGTDYPDEPTPDYQGWCIKYPTHEDLIEAAIADLGATAA